MFEADASGCRDWPCEAGVNAEAKGERSYQPGGRETNARSKDIYKGNRVGTRREYRNGIREGNVTDGKVIVFRHHVATTHGCTKHPVQYLGEQQEPGRRLWNSSSRAGQAGQGG